MNPPEDFITSYEAALRAQDWRSVEPLVHPDACVTFSNGAVHEGRAAVEAAFARNFKLIQSEQYEVSNVRWVTRTDSFAVYLFDFAWKGIINGKEAGGSGRGTTVLVRDESTGTWQLLAEHLGPRAM